MIDIYIRVHVYITFNDIYNRLPWYLIIHVCKRLPACLMIYAHITLVLNNVGKQVRNDHEGQGVRFQHSSWFMLHCGEFENL